MSPKVIKKACRTTITLLINVIIVLAIVKVFSYSFKFTYDVFGKVSMEPGSIEYIVVNIPSDSTTTEISETLVEAGLCDNKYVMITKIKLGNLGSNIESGKYGLSPSMTYDEILNIICGMEEEEEE